jgi:hypothetical protein
LEYVVYRQLEHLHQVKYDLISARPVFVTIFKSVICIASRDRSQIPSDKFVILILTGNRKGHYDVIYVQF